MRTRFDFDPFRRSSVGFDRLFDLLENGASLLTADTYPPFDIVQEGGDRYRVALAVAGFREDELEISVQQNQLTVVGRKPADEARDLIHRGIGARSFERRFVLGDYVQARGATLENGLLTIELVREVPEAMKPRRIAIGGAPHPALTDRHANDDDRARDAA